MRNIKTLSLFIMGMFVATAVIQVAFPQITNAITNQQLNDIAIGQSTCYGMPPGGKDACLKGFRDGYRNINPQNRCKGIDSSRTGNCTTGYDQGQTAFRTIRNIRDEGGSGSSNTKTPVSASNDTAIKKDCETDIKSISGDKDDLLKACLAGAQGRLDGEDLDDTCKFTRNEQSACLKGYSKTSKKVDPADTDTRAEEAQEDPQADCDAKLNSTLSWILCPVIDLGVNMSDYVFQNFIEPFLENVPISTDPKDGAYKAWQQFRILANVLLIGTLLAIVYAQIKGDR